MVRRIKTPAGSARCHSYSFRPIVHAGAKVLILGSMPGIKSLEAGQYYHHPRNTFWPILSALFNAKADTYAQRLELVASNKLAVWDVLKYCYREGSLDSSIDSDSIKVNDFAAFLSRYPKIRHVFFNGQKAAAEFRKRVLPTLPAKFDGIKYHVLPSTSPAMASLNLQKKTKAWSKIKSALKN